MTVLQTAPAAPLTAPTARSRVELRAHRSLRGPYTAGGDLLRRLVPELMAAAPELVAPHSWAVVVIAPDLAHAVPRPPQTLTNRARGEERTRYYSALRTRDLAHAVSQLVRDWVSRCHPEGVELLLWEMDDADPTDVELVRTLRRRCPAPAAVVEEVPGSWHTHRPAGPVDDLAQAFVDADGTAVDPAQRAAYEALPEAERRRRHGARAELLQALDLPGSRLGALPYHLERGPEPAQEGADALMEALDTCFDAAFYDAAEDFARRGQAVVSLTCRPQVHARFTQRQLGALTYLDRTGEALAVIRGHRRTTTDGVAQMRCYYMMAMLYTRHLPAPDRDQDLALELINTAIALADGSGRAFFSAFMRNARGLVEMHRGDLQRSLELVEEAIALADAELDADQHRLHRAVLVHNRARVLLGLGRAADALADFDEVVARDPEYAEIYFDRAMAHRTLGQVEQALSDLSQALSLSPTFGEAYYNRADLSLELGDEDLALRDLDALLDIEPDHADALLNRAAVHLSHGDLDLAEVDVRHGLQVAADSPHLWSARGLLEATSGDDDAAEESYGRALELAPDLVEALGNRAVLRFSTGRVADAVRDLDRALEQTDGPVLRLNRGIGRQSLGDHEGALADFDAALALPGVDAPEVLGHREQSARALGAAAPAEDAVP